MKRQLPKNVRQIGNVSDSTKIYIEDYVDTFFNQLCEKADRTMKGAFLVGEIVREHEEDYIYVYGAIQMKEVLQKGKDIYISDSTWKNGCEICKQYFGNAEILGWFLTTEGQAFEVNHNTLKIHQKMFSRERTIFVVKEAREKEENYYVYKFKDLMECKGHYIYYEKNAEMQNYMIANRKKTGMTPSEIIEDTVTKNFRSVIRDRMQTKEKKSHSKFTYALSTFLVLVVLVIGVTMVNNYDKMKGMQDTLNHFNEDVLDKEEAVETIGNIVQLEQEEEPLKEEEQEEMKDEVQEEVEKEDVTETTPPETPTKPEQVVSKEEVYTVQKGDTLASISNKIYGDSNHIEEICKLNGLEDGNLILVGQKLLLP